MTLSCASLTSSFPWALACGSIVGSEHRRVHRNNQDAVAAATSEDVTVVAVADGCSGGPASEVGARLAVRWIARWTPRLLAEHGNVPALSTRVADGLQAYLLSTLHALGPSPGDLEDSVAEMGLFTFLTAVITPEVTQIFGVGDGAYCVNGDVVALSAGPENAPPYLAYRLLDRRIPLDTQVVLHHRGPTPAIDHVWIATDGVLDAREHDATGELSANERLVTNPYALQRLLNRWSLNGRFLRDDTTVALVRRCA